MNYKASMDTTTKIITFGVLIIMIISGLFAIRAIMLDGDTFGKLFYISILLLLIVIVPICYLYAPQSYSVNDRELTINRPLGKVCLKLTDIGQVQVFSDKDAGIIFRTFGVGGLFGYFGKFYATKIGHLQFYTTQLKNRILILTSDGKKIVITPDDMGLLEKIKP